MTPKQRRFIDEYMIDFNATQAAIRAGYSENTARAIGCENLTKPDIADEVKRRIEELALSSHEALIRLSEQARAEYAAYIKADGSPSVDVKGMLEDGKAHLIKSIKYTQHGVNVDFYDAQAALIQIGRVHKLFTDKTEVTGADGKPLLTADALTAAMSAAIPQAQRIAEKAAAMWSDEE